MEDAHDLTLVFTAQTSKESALGVAARQGHAEVVQWIGQRVPLSEASKKTKVWSATHTSPPHPVGLVMLCTHPGVVADWPHTCDCSSSCRSLPGGTISHS